MHRLRAFVPSANYLFVFEAAARRQSFTAAAEELNISQPAVSKTIRLLEDATGLKLFQRDHRRLDLTAEGRRLYQETQQSFDQLHMVISTLRRKHSRDTVRVSFSASFVQFFLLPRLTGFKKLHPDISLRIEESSRDIADLEQEDIDLSARLGHGKWPGLDAWHFVTEEIFAVCSPTYLKEHGPIRRVADLTEVTLLHFDERYRTRLGWREWLRLQGITTDRLRQDFVFSDALASIEAAVQGQGFALGWKHLVRDHVAAGRLVSPLNVGHKTGQSIYLVMPAGRPLKPGAELLRDWLLAQEPDAELRKVACPRASPRKRT
jgi:LysR family glycine cleavage system transcriptional activator